MIDLHSHVLPGLDDGPSTLAESIALAEAAARDGTTVLAATPHLRADHPAVRVEELAERCAALNAALEGRHAPRIVSGGEVDLLWALSADREQLVRASYAGRGTDLLVETPYGPLPPDFEDRLFELALEGFRVLLAHPERSAAFQARPERLTELVRRGVLVQLTATSLLRPDRRSRSRQLAVELIRGGYAHVLASDAHGLEGARPPLLSAGARAAAEVARERASWMVDAAPAAILAGEALPPVVGSGGPS